MNLHKLLYDGVVDTAGTLCGSCGNGTVVSVLRMLCRDDCLWDQGFYVVAAVLGRSIIVILETYYKNFSNSQVIADIGVIILILMLSVKFGLLFPHSLKPLLFYVQVLNSCIHHLQIFHFVSRLCTTRLSFFRYHSGKQEHR